MDSAERAEGGYIARTCCGVEESVRLDLEALCTRGGAEPIPEAFMADRGCDAVVAQVHSADRIDMAAWATKPEVNAEHGQWFAEIAQAHQAEAGDDKACAAGESATGRAAKTCAGPAEAASRDAMFTVLP